VVPKNILMIGPTGCGKTEIARRLARLANAPFLKVEATKFTEVGYVGRDVESIVRDLVEVSITQTRDNARKEVQAKAELAAEERLVTALVGEGASGETRMKFRRMLREGASRPRGRGADRRPGRRHAHRHDRPAGRPGHPDAEHAGDARQDVRRPHQAAQDDGGRRAPALIRDEADKLLDQEALTRDAVANVENNGIVFLDEIDKICARTGEGGFRGGDVSREGVQRDLLPLIEGTTVTTKQGPVKTDHILFIASGAFHLAKPSDLLPELQGRLPLRVELAALTRDDFRRILTEPEHSLIKQYVALLGTEGMAIEFTDDSVDAIADLAADINAKVENIGARRLATVMERMLEEISFTASDRGGEAVRVDGAYVQEKVAPLAGSADLSRYIL
jgi:ATP-dependent HslUV protease ATP-binding subunit HslU